MSKKKAASTRTQLTLEQRIQRHKDALEKLDTKKQIADLRKKLKKA